MNTKSAHCPACGKPASGQFCSHCGASLAAGAAAKPVNAPAIVPWISLGTAVVALVVALVAFFDGGSQSTPNPFVFPETPTAGIPASPQSIDLSSMTPREAADRLFNRVMAASERGDTAEALKFVPMALQAYEQLETLDNDARYHVALIHLTSGDINGTRVQLVALRQAVPNHLLGFMLEHDIAERNKDKASDARAIKSFLAAYDKEIATGRSEYQDHRGQIERFHASVQAKLAGKN